jgi:putative component of membrane protein insertase Oxa1/YidC/SpoIIIJ protein YidD
MDLIDLYESLSASHLQLKGRVLPFIPTCSMYCVKLLWVGVYLGFYNGLKCC